METKIYNQTGKEAGKFKLPVGIFDLPWNADLVHEVVRLMNSNSRTNVAHTKTRGEVRGGGKKPWKQKGTGRARHGSSRSPIWVGGGVTHGPRNDQNFNRKINKKVKDKALLTVLSRKWKDGEILFVDAISLAKPKSKDARAILTAFGSIKGFEKVATKKKNAALIAFDKRTEAVDKSFKNFGNISIEEFRNINPVSLMNHSYLIVVNPENSLKTLSAKVTQA
ncbi:MAG TPA: 50S ribosomal protein L4 [Candidatus Paceibacterota bacterium]|jgi:large subunit ribosomal protein L4|nr:50S ribosomal protein L4 [Candidatus Paceibacterota bacterium]